jgi:hypothetical protein
MRIKKSELIDKITSLQSQEEYLSNYEIAALKDFLKKLQSGKYLSPRQKSFLQKIEETAEKAKNKPQNPTQQRIQKIINSPHLNDWSKNFLNSINTQVSRGRELSEKQISLLEKIEKSVSPEEVEKKQNWEEEFKNDEYKKKVFSLCCDYYKQTSYYKRIYDKFIKNPEYIPSRDEYETLCENKYARRIVESFLNSPPKFEKGDLVIVKSHMFCEDVNKKFSFLIYLSPSQESIGIISEVEPRCFVSNVFFSGNLKTSVLSAAKGCRLYRVHILKGAKKGSYIVEERGLQRTSRKKRK